MQDSAAHHTAYSMRQGYGSLTQRHLVQTFATTSVAHRAKQSTAQNAWLEPPAETLEEILS